MSKDETARLNARVEVLRERVRQLEAELALATGSQSGEAEAKREFLGNISHELRTPLNGILGMASLLEDSKLTERQQEFVLGIIRSGHDLLKLVNNLLNLSQLTNGTISLAQKRFSLRERTAAVLSYLQEIAQDKKLDFSWTVSEKLPDTCVGDPDRFSQILLNIAGNAVKYTVRGRVEISLDEGRIEAPDTQACEDTLPLLITVRDTGCGVPEAKRESIFEPFCVGEEMLNKSCTGAGLGLSISRDLAERMGGKIWFESEALVGSTFYALLRLHCPERQAAVLSSPAKPLSLLLVEDEEISRMYARILLGKLGHTVAVAENGREALSMLSDTAYDLVLMDIQMPEMTGLEAANAIREGRAGAANKGVPIVALTVLAGDADREFLLSAGMDGYLTKPVDAGRLNRAIAEAMAAGGHHHGPHGSGQPQKGA